jgi:hypothetical protein
LVIRVPLGFSADNLIVINAQPNPFNVPDLRAFYLHAVETLGSRADVLAAGAGGAVPPDGFGRSEAVEITGDQRPVDALYVLPGYLETIGLGMLRGRRLSSEDIDGANAAVLSESAARALFPNQEAIGATFRTREGRQFAVVGVVNDVRRSLTRQLDPLAYVIPPPRMTRGMTLIARMRTRRAADKDDEPGPEPGMVAAAAGRRKEVRPHDRGLGLQGDLCIGSRRRRSDRSADRARSAGENGR